MTTRTSRPPRQRRTAGRFLAARSPRPDSLAAVSAHHSSSPLCTAKGRADPKGGPPHCHSAHLVFANGGAAAPASRLRAVASVGTDRVAAWDDDHSSAFRRARRSLSPGESSSLSSGDLRCRASSGATVSASVIRAPACSRGCFAKVRARGSAGVRGAFRALRGRGGLGGGAAGRPSRAFRAPLRPLRLLSGACGASVSCVLR
jgi:hypothetical protein